MRDALDGGGELGREVVFCHCYGFQGCFMTKVRVVVRVVVGGGEECLFCCC